MLFFDERGRHLHFESGLVYRAALHGVELNTTHAGLRPFDRPLTNIIDLRLNEEVDILNPPQLTGAPIRIDIRR